MNASLLFDFATAELRAFADLHRSVEHEPTPPHPETIEEWQAREARNRYRACSRGE